MLINTIMPKYVILTIVAHFVEFTLERYVIMEFAFVHAFWVIDILASCYLFVINLSKNSCFYYSHYN